MQRGRQTVAGWAGGAGWTISPAGPRLVTCPQVIACVAMAGPKRSVKSGDHLIAPILDRPQKNCLAVERDASALSLLTCCEHYRPTTRLRTSGNQKAAKLDEVDNDDSKVFARANARRSLARRERAEVLMRELAVPCPSIRRVWSRLPNAMQAVNEQQEIVVR